MEETISIITNNSHQLIEKTLNLDEYVVKELVNIELEQEQCEDINQFK